MNLNVTRPRALWGKHGLSTLEVSTPDITDEQVWLQATNAATTRLTRGFSDIFSFGQADLLILTNRGGEKATVRLSVPLAAEEALYVGSTRRGGWIQRPGDIHAREVVLAAGEVLTIRSLHTKDPASGDTLLPGQVTAR